MNINNQTPNTIIDINKKESLLKSSESEYP